MQELLTPSLHSTHRTLFEQAFQRGEADQARLYSVGGQIEQVSQNVAEAYVPEEPEAAVSLYQARWQAPLADYIETQRTHVASSVQGVSSTGRRVELYGRLADQLVLLPTLFRRPDSSPQTAIRRKLIEVAGMYGIISEVLEGAYTDYLQTFRSVGHASYDHQHTTGIVTELTALALLNRGQSPSFFALPSLPAQDWLRKIDAVAYFSSKDVDSAHLQVKTNERFHDLPSQNIQLIGGIALGNNWRSRIWDDQRTTQLQTTQAIIEENNGTVSDAHADILDRLHDSLITAVRRGEPFAAVTGQTAQTA